MRGGCPTSCRCFATGSVAGLIHALLQLSPYFCEVSSFALCLLGFEASSLSPIALY
jgi:hypothetical protein